MKEVVIKELIFKDTQFTTQDEVFHFLAHQLKKCNRSTSVQDVVAGFYAREAEFSTYIDDGMAIPHCRNTSIQDATVAVVLNKEPIPWTDMKEGAKTIFALLIPAANENQIHIRVLAQVAQMLMQETFVESLQKAQTEDELYDVVKTLNKEIALEEIEK